MDIKSERRVSALDDAHRTGERTGCRRQPEERLRAALVRAAELHDECVEHVGAEPLVVAAEGAQPPRERSACDAGIVLLLLAACGQWRDASESSASGLPVGPAGAGALVGDSGPRTIEERILRFRDDAQSVARCRKGDHGCATEAAQRLARDVDWQIEQILRTHAALNGADAQDRSMLLEALARELAQALEADLVEQSARGFAMRLLSDSCSVHPATPASLAYARAELEGARKLTLELPDAPAAIRERIEGLDTFRELRCGQRSILVASAGERGHLLPIVERGKR